MMNVQLGTKMDSGDSPSLRDYEFDSMCPSPLIMDKPKNEFNSREFSWLDRANIIFFHLHPDLGGNNTNITETTFGVNKSTLAGWLTSKTAIAKWYPFVESLDVQQVLRAVPAAKRGLFSSAHPTSKPNLVKYAFAKESTDVMEGTMEMVNNRKAYLLTNGQCKKRKRIGDHLGRPLIYYEQRNWIIEIVQQRWESGEPISKLDLVNAVKLHWVNDKDFFSSLLDPTGKNYPDSLHKFINRTLQRSSYMNNKKAICEVVPNNWRQIVEEGSQRICDRMKSEGVEALVAMDEIMFRFCPSSMRSTPFSTTTSGISSNDGSSILDEPADSKLSCTVFAAVDLLSDSFLNPFLVFGGSPNTIQPWQPHPNSHVAFHECHYQNSNITIDFLKTLRFQFPRKKIGLIVDAISSHYSMEVLNFINESNKTCEEKIILEFVERGVAAAYLPGIVGVNKIIKETIEMKLGHYKYSEAFLSDGISCQHLTLIIEDSLRFLNTNEKKSKCIIKIMRMCGLDIYDTERVHAEKYLNCLSVNSLYDQLISHQLYVEI